MKRKRSTVAAPRWTEAEALEVIEDWMESGLSGRVFAKQRGFNPQRLYWWRRRLNGTRDTFDATYEEKGPDVIVPVTLRDVSRGGGGVRLCLPSGVILDVPSGTPPEWVAAMARALAED